MSTTADENDPLISAPDDTPDPIPDTFVAHARRVGVMAGANAATFLSMFSITFVATLVVGRSERGSLDVSAFCLGCCWSNMIAFATITGSVMALDTILPQALGSARGSLVANFVQRCLASVLCFILVVLFPILLSAPSWLPILLPSTDSEIVRLAAQTMQLSTATLPLYLLEETLQSYLSALDYPRVITFGAFCAAIANPLLQWGLQTALGFDGAVVGWTASFFIMVVATWAAARYYNCFASTWTGWDFRKNFLSPRRWKVFVSHAAPITGSLLMEWSCFELTGAAIAATLLPAEQFAAQMILQQFTTIMFPTVLGICVAVNVFVGIEVGAGRPQAAQRVAVAGYALCICEFVINVSVLIGARHEIPKLFLGDISRHNSTVIANREQRVIDFAASALPWAALSHITDSSFCFVGNVLRAHGHQKLSTALAALSYLLIGLPCAWACCRYMFDGGVDLRGLWIGNAVGQMTGAVLGGVVMLRMDWNQTAEMQDDLLSDSEEED